MTRYNFLEYNREAELPGGDYWEFLNASHEILEADDINLSHISNIIENIINDELKLKMKIKLLSLIMTYGIYYNGLDRNLDIFNSNELKLIIKHHFDNKILYFLTDEERAARYLGDITLFIDMIEKVQDLDWKYSMITNILDLIKTYNNKYILVNVIEYIKYDKVIYNSLIAAYYNELPTTYKNFLEMQQDPYYIHHKTLEFMTKDIDVGIDPGIKIAPEIEANIDYKVHLDLYGQKEFTGYAYKSDATVPNGCEVVPFEPFHNTTEDVAKFCALCETMQDVGYYYNATSQNAAGQINLGLDYLDTKEAILMFYEIYGNCEELLYYISNESGQLFRQDVFVNSRIKPISEIIGIRTLDEGLSRQEIINLFNSKIDRDDNSIKKLKYKSNSVCLRGESDKDYRLEFRIPNGGCNYNTWIDNIRLYGKMLEVAKKLADIMRKKEITIEEEKLLRLKLSLQDKLLFLEEKLDILMELLFEDIKIRQIYYDRYESTIKKIDETNSRKYLKPQNHQLPAFSEVEFLSQYHSMLDYDQEGSGLVVTYDPDTDTLTSTKR